MLTPFQTGNLHVPLGAKNGFLKGQHNPLLEIVTPLRLLGARAANVIEE